MEVTASGCINYILLITNYPQSSWLNKTHIYYLMAPVGQSYPLSHVMSHMTAALTHTHTLPRTWATLSERG